MWEGESTFLQRREGGNKGNKSCPRYGKVPHGKKVLNSLSKSGQDLLLLLPHSWYVRSLHRSLTFE